MDAVDAGGDVTEFTIDSTTANRSLEPILTQVALENPTMVDNGMGLEPVDPGTGHHFHLDAGVSLISIGIQSMTSSTRSPKTTPAVARSGNITFVTLQGDVRAVLRVTQLSSTLDTLSLEVNEIAVDQRAGNDGLIVNSNTDWGWEITLERYDLFENQDQTNFDNSGDNGSFVGGDRAGVNSYVSRMTRLPSRMDPW